jgi:hydroxymethylbilane synthase
MSNLRLGTRGSLLATTQSGWVASALGLNIELVKILTEGDNLAMDLTKPNLPGAFVNSLRAALLNGEVDFIVHSFKDLPSAEHPELLIAAIPVREDPRDVLITKNGGRFESLEIDSVIGTSSPRRTAAIRHLNPELDIRPIRGNVDSRIQKVRSGEFDATVLAAAGINRIGRSDEIDQYLDLKLFLPAPAQGVLAVECRADNSELIDALSTIDDFETRLSSTAERSVLRGLKAGCELAISAFAQVRKGELILTARLADPDTADQVEVEESVELPAEHMLIAAEELGHEVAAMLAASELGARLL